MTAAGKTLAGYTAGDWRADSRWAAGHARSCADEAGVTGRQAAGVLARWRDAAVKFDRDADEHRGLCSEPRHPDWQRRPCAEAEAGGAMTCGLAPGHAWSRCGGNLPRSCATEVTVTRRRWTGERIHHDPGPPKRT